MATVKPKQSVEFLEDDKGNKSLMRLMSLIALIAAIVSGGYTLIKSPKADQVGTNITFTFLAAAFTGKAAQKFAEVNEPS